jgi:heparan-alpha-glucosaminide N-acetyltransferase
MTTIFAPIPTTPRQALSTPKASVARVASIDALRGLIMFTMIVVNKLAGNPVVPAWMEHHDPKTSGMTFVDIVFPAFLFIAGMSIPFALGSRLKNGESAWTTLRHVLMRVISLLLIGVMTVNKPPDPSKWGWGSQTWVFLMYVSVIATFCSIAPVSRESTNEMRRIFRRINLMVRIVGLIFLIYLAFAWRGPHGERIVTLSPFFISTSWWGILGQIGWSYLMASIVFLLFRTRADAVLACAALMVAMYFASAAHLFGGFWPARYVDFGTALGTHSMLTTSGMLLGIMLVNPQMNSVAARAKYTVIFVLGFSAAAILLHGQFGIYKNSATPSWGLWGCAITAALWLILYFLIDVVHLVSLSRPLMAAGQNVLLAYILSLMLNPTLGVIGLLDWYLRSAHDLAGAIVRAVATAVAILALTCALNRAGFRLRF